MIRAFTAFTGEIDDGETAVAEIMDQLGGCEGLSKNSIGFLTCYSEFVDSGVMKEICDALPFDVIGSTTLGNAVRGSAGRMLLTLMVITSDEAEFSIGLTEPLSDGDAGALRAAYEEAASRITGKPALMVSFAPLLLSVSGDFYVNSFADISGGVPNFGMLAVDSNDDFRDSQVISRGEAYRDRYAFALFGGGVTPRFFISSISSEKVFMEKGVVTSADGNRVHAVNDKPAVEYLEGLGLKKNADGTIASVTSFPFVVDYNDGSFPVVRVIFSIAPDGSAVCGGDIPMGATVSVGHVDCDEVLATTTEAVSDAMLSGEAGCAFMFSCAARYLALGYETMSEQEKVQNLMEGVSTPYLFSYSGGELCPVPSGGDSAVLVNRNHNETFIMCLL
ncbi:MAG: FIST C-terminal domain-containing protein [Synergistaceae bacterium]|jgi:hypothetical protein|nr:FIST C-terminal domain-containing protein [Synergistaceae bacterium]